MASRRAVLSGVGLALLCPLGRNVRASAPLPIIDTHLHFPRTRGGEVFGFAVAAALRAHAHRSAHEAVPADMPFPQNRHSSGIETLR